MDSYQRSDLATENAVLRFWSAALNLPNAEMLQLDRACVIDLCHQLVRNLEDLPEDTTMQDIAEDSASQATVGATEAPKDKTEMALPVLPDDVLANIVDGDYHPSWMADHNIPDHYLEGWTSKKKLDVLVGHHALELGDFFSFKFVDANDAVVDRQVHLLNTEPKSHFNVDIFDPVAGTTLGTPLSCSGLSDVLVHLLSYHDDKRYDGPPKNGYEGCQVWRNGQNVGNLHDIRQRFTLREVLRLRKAGSGFAFSQLNVKTGQRAGSKQGTSASSDV